MEAKEDKTPWKDLMDPAIEKAPDGFTDRFMTLLEQEAAASVPVKPLFSRRTWLLIGIWALALFSTSLYFWGQQDLSGLGVAKSFLPQWELDFEGMPQLPELPSTFAWCGMALLVFAFLQMRWMYRSMLRRLAL